MHKNQMIFQFFNSISLTLITLGTRLCYNIILIMHFHKFSNFVVLYICMAMMLKLAIIIRNVNGYGFMGFRPGTDLFGAILSAHKWFWGG